MHESGSDLHDGFREPRLGVSAALTGFLDEVDRLPGIRAVRQAMRAAVELRPGMRVLDAGCGIGSEVTRLAVDHPAVEFTGLDKNAELLGTAQSRAASVSNLTWVHAALEDFETREAYDVVRSERVLMYSPGPLFGQVLDLVVQLVRPGGRLVLFELDYGGNILPTGHGDDDVVHALEAVLERALPQPWAGRKIPVELASRGLVDITATPYAFGVNETVWRAIVHDTLRTALDQETAPAELHSWLDAQAASAGNAPFLGAFTGVLTVARRPAAG
ncbi:methyltransferase domain-containing protein [Saccharopolyspora sp. 5N708]|uniref:methyltransferase domain-containing protein n=1 Tax=Saccharopolyspora sp. 5N708 TaxID=3457424 RepID=UPI003FD3C3D3